MELDIMGIEIYAIHEYYYGLTVGQRTPKFWDVTDILPKYRLSMEVDTISSTNSWLEEILGIYH